MSPSFLKGSKVKFSKVSLCDLDISPNFPSLYIFVCRQIWTWLIFEHVDNFTTSAFISLVLTGCKCTGSISHPQPFHTLNRPHDPMAVAFSHHWSSRSKKTLLMSTPKRTGDQIFRFTWVKLTIIPPPPNLKLPEHWVNSLLSNVANESPFEIVN